MNVAALKPLAQQAAINGLLSKGAPFRRKNKFGLGLLALSGLLSALALIFACISLYGWLLLQFAQPVAASIMAGSVMAAAFLSALGGHLVLKKKQRPAFDQSEITEIISEVSEFIGDELAEPIQQNPKTAMLLAGLAGVIAGDRLH